jgi:glycosyltransferase involved in cell wall biosynthesis
LVANGSEVRKVLDEADLFVLPSRAEGLPRALIEAMARGLPAVASDVGGCGELLAKADLVSAGSASLLATAVQAILDDPERMSRAAEQNLANSREYAESLLEDRRRRFYDKLLRVSEPSRPRVQEAQ